jgi:Arc/MetJ-type ribon-helix-helix transcriptional regulator
MRKPKPKSEWSRKLSVSLPPEMTTWLRRSAAKQLSNVSQVIRDYLRPAFEKRHAK